ncbi:IS110 family transposase [Pendulispora brunnea]|uniref:IS110 family transposase n=1 Tax=Pendulispora brunnea TaxID=2905690 RepID=A0ABZ2K553_9BACT
MRSVGLDLGARHIAYCEVCDGKVVERTSVQQIEQLKGRLGPGTLPAIVAFEAAREAWFVHDLLRTWGHEPKIVDTTRLKTIGIGHHKRKNDALDAEHLAIAVEQGRIPEAHVLSVEGRELREQLSVRQALVETRAGYVTTIRGLARAHGKRVATCDISNFVTHLEATEMNPGLQKLVAPLAAMLKVLDEQLVRVEEKLQNLAGRDPRIRLCATAPGIGLIVGATFMSVMDDAHRFKNAHAVSAYLGLVPSESTTGGPSKRRLGGITKQGNPHARAMLVQAAHSLLRTRKHAGDPIRLWGMNIAKKKGRSIAAVAVARRLAGVLWAMCRDGAFYDPNTATKGTFQKKSMRGSDETQRTVALRRATKKLQRRYTRRKTSEVTMT